MNLEKILAYKSESVVKTFLEPSRLRTVAHKRNVNASVKRLVPIARMVRRAKVDAALNLLDVYPKQNAKLIRKAISSARGNALVKGFDPSDLYIGVFLFFIRPIQSHKTFR